MATCAGDKTGSSAEPAAPAAVKGRVTNDPAVRTGMRRWGLAVFDQGIVSGSRFLATIIVGRGASPHDLGNYSIAFTVLVLAGCAQEALVTTPYAIHVHRLGRSAKRMYAGGAWLLHAALAATAALVLLLGAWCCRLEHLPREWTRLLFMLAAVTPLSLMWEFSRRFLMAELKFRTAALLDAATAALQLGGLAVLMVLGRLTAETALLTIGGGCMVPAAAWLIHSRKSRGLCPSRLPMYWWRSWRLGKWLVGGQMIGAIHAMLPTWLVAGSVGAGAAGVLVASQNIGAITIPLIFAVGNMLTPRAAQAYARQGVGAVMRLVRNASVAMGGLFAVFAGILALWGDRIVSLVYGGQYAGSALVPAVFGACTIFWAATAAAASGLAAVRRPRACFIGSVAGTCVSGIAIVTLVWRWEVLGAAVGLMVGSAASTAIHLAALIDVSRTGRAAGRSAAGATATTNALSGLTE